MRAVLVVAALCVAVYAGTNPVGLKYLEENKAKEGVVETSSGLQVQCPGIFLFLLQVLVCGPGV